MSQLQCRKRNGATQLSVSCEATKDVPSPVHWKNKMPRSTARNDSSWNSRSVRPTQPSRVPVRKRQDRLLPYFCNALRCSPPAVPPSLLKFASDIDLNKNWNGSQALKKKDVVGPGRVKVLLRVCPEFIRSPGKNGDRQRTTTNKGSSILRVEGNRKHVTIFDSETGLRSAHMRVGVSAPKLYAFDAVFPEDTSQVEVCSTSLIDVIQAVVQGADGAVFCYGHSGLGKTYTLLGGHESERDLGIIPCAISWLYRAIGEVKDKTMGRFSIRVSSVEVHGRSEQLKDLLKEHAKDDVPGEDVCVREDPLFGTQLQNQCELRASSAEKAAYYLDAALAARSSSASSSTEEARRHSHMVYTLHIYQYRLDKSDKAGVTGGRSRLHFIDLGSCEKTLVKTPNSLTLSLSSLGHVIMAIVNNSKHVPFKESKLTLVLQDLLGNFNCRTVMLAHVAKGSKHYAETLSTVQMASRIHRVLLKKRTKGSSSAGSSKSVAGCHTPRSIQSRKTKGTDDDSIGTSSGVAETSGSEVSCDTVIYVRPNGVPYSDRELTDNEGPPISVPVQPPLQSKKVLTKISENDHCSSGELVIRDITQREKCSVVKVTNPTKSPKSPNSKLHSMSPSNASTTQLKLANHAKLIGNIRDGERQESKQSGSDVRFDTTKGDKRSSKSPLKKQSNRISQPQKCPKSPNSRGKKHKSRIPPPPPPRLPSTRLRSDSSHLPQPTYKQKNNADISRKTNFHQPLYETLLSSHRSLTRKNLKKSEYFEGIPQRCGTSVEKGSKHSMRLAVVERDNLSNTAKYSITDAVPASRRSEPDGSDSTTRDSPRNTTGSGATAVTNLSYSTMTIDRTKSDLSRCMQNFGDVLNAVEDHYRSGDLIEMVSQDERRPTSLLVNVNESEWNSSEDDDTLTSDKDYSDEEDVVGVEFYCLSFTTKNPLIPLSKRSFVRQVSVSKRMNLEGQSSGGSTASDTSRVNQDMEEGTRCKNIDDVENSKNGVASNNDYGGNCARNLKRSRTFDVESDLPMSLLPDESQDKANEGTDGVEEDKRSLENSAISVDENSTVSSPSQVLLYDSSSLEINYLKPKSFQDTSCSRSEIREAAIRSPRDNISVHCMGKITQVPRKPLKVSEDGKKILATGSGNGSGTQLSLVRSDGDESGLEIVINAEETDSGRQSTVRDMISNSSHSLNYARDLQKNKSSPAKRLKWGGLKRFGSKKSKERTLAARTKSGSPTADKSSNKVENPLVGNVKSTSSLGQSFVGKLLSPKSRRGRRASLQSGKTNFHYRTPVAISETKSIVARQSTKTNAINNIESMPDYKKVTSSEASWNRGRFGFSQKA